MDRTKLKEIVEKRTTIREIAIIEKCSPTNIRYWIRKYGIKIRNKVGRRPELKPKPDCIFCGKPIKKSGIRYCSNKCQIECKYRDYISKWLQGKISGNKGSGETISGWIRRYCLERARYWSKKNKYTGKIPLTVHHSDGNYKNTCSKNLKVLCPCCHSLTPTYGNLNKGRGRKNRLENIHSRGH
jgi:hypothetical protein